MERKVCFISDTGSWWERVADACPKVDSAPCPHPCKQRVRVFKAEWGWGGQHAETTQSSRTVFFKLIISGLTSIILVVLDTVSLQFWGPFVPISLWSILGIVVTRVLGIMQLTFPPGVLVSIRQLTGHGSEYLSTALEKELKVLDYAWWLHYYCLISLDSFPLFPHFLLLWLNLFYC